MPRALIYTRASSDPKMMLRSVGDQEADARAWCDREGWEVVGIETDANRSATQWARREREGFNRVLARIARQEIDVLVMWEASRGAREMQGFIDLKAALVSAGVLLAYGGKVYDLSRGDNVFAASLDALLAEREASGIRDRIVRTVRIRAEKGTPHGPVPYGYRRLYDDRTGALLKQIPDPETAPIVREITRRILAGETISAIARDLNHRGIATPKPPRKPELSRGWLAKTVSQLVLTPAIVGLRQHRGEIAGTASWEGLISRQDWDRIGQMFRDPARQTHRGPATMHLLSWIVRCGSCGTAMVAAVQRGKPRGLSCRNDMCTHRVYIDEAMTDIYVTDVITAWLSTPQTLAALRQSEGKDAPNVDISALGEQLGILEVRLADAAAKYIDGELSAGMLATVERGLQPQIDSLRRQIAPSPAPVDPEDVLQASNPARVLAAGAARDEAEFHPQNLRHPHYTHSEPGRGTAESGTDQDFAVVRAGMKSRRNSLASSTVIGASAAAAARACSCIAGVVASSGGVLASGSSRV